MFQHIAECFPALVFRYDLTMSVVVVYEEYRSGIVNVSAVYTDPPESVGELQGYFSSLVAFYHIKGKIISVSHTIYPVPKR
jgi:hypothetical protein